MRNTAGRHGSTQDIRVNSDPCHSCPGSYGLPTGRETRQHTAIVIESAGVLYTARIRNESP